MKIILCGACGRMGQNVIQAVESADAEIVCGVDLKSAPLPFPLYSSFAEVHETADVLIDFSSPVALAERLEFCEQRNIPAVLAATGYSAEDLALIESYSKRIALFKTGNFSIGINLLQFFVKAAAKSLGGDFDVEIIERHHNQKKDAPSGTALMLAESVNEGLGGDMTNVYGRQGVVGARDRREIGIHAVRGGTIVGEHEVMFAGDDEVITFSHSARSRKIFANGALKAAHWLIGKPAGKYDMSDLLADVLPFSVK